MTFTPARLDDQVDSDSDYDDDLVDEIIQSALTSPSPAALDVDDLQEFEDDNSFI